MKKTWMRLAAGILNIIAGTLNIATLFLFLFIYRDWEKSHSGGEIFGWGLLLLIPYFLSIGALAIFGGISALERKRWPIVLAGSIGSTLTFFFISILGIVSIVFTVLSKSEFSSESIDNNKM